MKKYNWEKEFKRMFVKYGFYMQGKMFCFIQKVLARQNEDYQKEITKLERINRKAIDALAKREKKNL